MLQDEVFDRGARLLRHWIFRRLVGDIRGEYVNSESPEDVIFSVPRNREFEVCTDDTLYELGVCQIPTRILNLIVSEQLARIYGDLYICECFYRLPSGAWYLDVDERLARTGFLIPVRNPQELIVGLNVFRHEKDEHPFRLQLRSQGRPV